MASLYIATVCGIDFGYVLSTPGATWISTVIKCPYDVGLIIYCLVICLSIMSLCVYHCDLICSGRTTYEKIKNIDGGTMSNNSNNGCQRLLNTIFAPPAPSQFDLRHEVFSDTSETTEYDPLIARSI